MALVKTANLKFVDGLLQQLHEPHPNTPDDAPKWIEVEGQEPAAPRQDVHVTKEGVLSGHDVPVGTAKDK